MDSNMLLYAFGELALLLLCVCIYLLFHVRGLKKLVGKFEDKVVQLRNTITLTKENAKKLIHQAREEGSSSYIDFIEEQIEATRDFHQSQSPDRDIVLDLDADVSIERQSAALRHAFLVSEKEASYAGEEDGPSWEVLRFKLEKIINFYQHAFGAKEANESDPEEFSEEDFFKAASQEHEQLKEELNNYKKRVENLEKFKKLFFELESKWDKAREEAEGHHNALKEQVEQLDVSEDFLRILDQYGDSYDSLAASFSEGQLIEGVAERSAQTLQSVDSNGQPVVSENKKIIVDNEKVSRLMKFMAEQQENISELKRKLSSCITLEEKDKIIEEMTAQFERQERFLKESEGCIQMLDDELSEARKQVSKLTEELEELQANAMERSEASENSSGEIRAGEIDERINKYVEESRDMLNTIALLEQENQQLKNQIEFGDTGKNASANGDNEDALELKAKLSDVQQELLNLQTQYIELEERYIELKSSSL
jgi:chromosome segregation ATPase